MDEPKRTGPAVWTSSHVSCIGCEYLDRKMFKHSRVGVNLYEHRCNHPESHHEKRTGKGQFISRAFECRTPGWCPILKDDPTQHINLKHKTVQAVRESVHGALEAFRAETNDRQKTRDEFNKLEKPDNCTCGFPEVIVRNMNGHDPSCPVYKEWARQSKK